MKKILMVLFSLIILSSFISAIPQSSEWNYNQLIIVYSKLDTFKKDTDSILNFNVLNSSGNMLNNTLADCNGNIYYLNGSFISGQTLVKSSNYVDFELNLSGTFINEIGEYYYTIYCNDSNEAGYLSKFFYVTNTGRKDEGDSGMKWLAILLSLVGMTGFLIWLTTIIEDQNLKPIKVLFFIMSVVNSLMIGIVSYLISLNPFDVISYRNLGIGYATVNVFIILGFLYNYYFAGFGGIFKRDFDKMKFNKGVKK